MAVGACGACGAMVACGASAGISGAAVRMALQHKRTQRCSYVAGDACRSLVRFKTFDAHPAVGYRRDVQSAPHARAAHQ